MHVMDHHSLEELERRARREKNAKVRIRLQALILAKRGWTAPQIAPELSSSRRRVQAWIARYNADALPGLAPRKQSGQPPHLPRESEQAFRERIEQGPRPQDGVCTLRGRDMRRILKDEFGALYSLNGVYALLHRLNYSCLMPRPQHEKADPAAQEAFKKKWSSSSKRSAPRTRGGDSKSGSKTKPASASKAR